MALLILLVLWIRRSSAATTYRLQAGIWLAGLPLLVASGHYYAALLQLIIGLLLLALSDACAECARLRLAARSAPLQLSITNAGPLHIDTATAAEAVRAALVQAINAPTL